MKIPRSVTRRSRGAGVTAVVLLTAVLAGTSGAAANVPLRSDFNGDGYDELVIAIPGRTIDGQDGAGALVIVPGGPEGVMPGAATQLLYRGAAGIPGEPAANERWGMVIAAADFNGDGFFDLAIGSPLAAVDGQPNRGDVVILFGSRQGLRTGAAQHIVPGEDLGPALFGAALAAGPFNADPLPDLAVGAPGAFAGAGAVVIYQAALIGPLARTSVLVAEMAEIGADRHSTTQGFGAALAAGGFVGPGTSLAIAARQRDRGGETGAAPGRIFIAHAGGAEGSAGIALAPAMFLDLDLDLGAAELAANAALYATLLLAADYDGDGFDDLTAALPTATVMAEGAPIARAGAVTVTHGGADALVVGETLLLLEPVVGFRDEIEAGDDFGTAIAAGDFDGDGFDDLVIGTPLEDDYGLIDRGTIHIVYGAGDGLNFVSRRMTVHHDLEYYGVPMSEPDNGNLYGAALGTGDFDGDGFHDLAIAIPGKAGANGEPNAGWVLVLYGSERGVTTAFGEIVSLETLTGLGLAAESNDYLGLALSGGAGACGLGALCMLLR